MGEKILSQWRLLEVSSRQLLRSMKQFVLEIMCSDSGEEMEEFILLARDEFISAMLRMHAANSGDY